MGCSDGCRLSFNYGRPILIPDVQVLNDARQILSHPLTNVNDSRLTTLVEAFLIRCKQSSHITFPPAHSVVPLHRPYRSLNSSAHDDEINRAQANREVEEWWNYWKEFYGMSARFALANDVASRGVPDDHFLVTERKYLTRAALRSQ